MLEEILDILLWSLLNIKNLLFWWNNNNNNKLWHSFVVEWVRYKKLCPTLSVCWSLDLSTNVWISELRASRLLRWGDSVGFDTTGIGIAIDCAALLIAEWSPWTGDWRPYTAVIFLSFLRSCCLSFWWIIVKDN